MKDTSRRDLENPVLARASMCKPTTTKVGEEQHEGGTEARSIRLEASSHLEGGALVKSLVFGGLDGIITTFAIVQSGVLVFRKEMPIYAYFLLQVATIAGARAHTGLVLLMVRGLPWPA